MIDSNLYFILNAPIDLLDDDEYQILVDYQIWCKKNKYQTKQYISLGEAFEIFKDDLYELCLESDLMDVLWQFKKWRSGSYVDKDKAKQYPIESLIEIRNGFANCPLHEDKTPSLKVYPSNTWYCFSCNQGGDTIDLVMKTQNISFINAVKQLI